MKLAMMMVALVAAMASVVCNAFTMPIGTASAARGGSSLAPSRSQPAPSRSAGESAVGALNVKVVLGEEENVEAALMRFRRTVSRSGHLQDLRWRRQFETVAEKKKRKKVQNLRKEKIQRARDRKSNQHKF